MKHTHYTLAAVAAILLTLSACDQAEQAAAPATTSPQYELVTDIHQTMAWVVEPAADVIWDSAGTIITIEGERELAPTTEEGWEKVLYAAATLTEASNLLMLPGRSAGDDWQEYARGLARAGQEAMKAAQARDSDALFEAGGNIYLVCRACHNQYWVNEGKED